MRAAFQKDTTAVISTNSDSGPDAQVDG